MKRWCISQSVLLCITRQNTPFQSHTSNVGALPGSYAIRPGSYAKILADTPKVDSHAKILAHTPKDLFAGLICQNTKTHTPSGACPHKRLDFNVEQLRWNDAFHRAEVLVKEAAAKEAIEAQKESIDAALKQRDAAFKLQQELKAEIESLGPRLQRAREGLKELEDTYFKPGHYVPPYTYGAQRDLKRTILAILSCLASAQERLLNVKDNIRDFDRVLFASDVAEGPPKWDGAICGLRRASPGSGWAGCGAGLEGAPA